MRQDPERDAPQPAGGAAEGALEPGASERAVLVGLADKAEPEQVKRTKKKGSRAKVAASAGRSRAVAVSGAGGRTISEARLNAPDRQTLWMLAIISVATLVMWGAGRAACNHHPPRETRRPRHVATAELARDPKNAAIEMQQRWATHNFSGALELATDKVAQQVQKELQACEADADACQKRHETLKGRVMTVGTLLEREANSARVRVTSIDQGKPDSYVLQLEQAGPIWKVRARAPAQ
jgi:hypothetical protein